MPTSEIAPRERIINSLALVVAQDGYGGAKIHDIVRGARVSLRTFYEEFPNKEAAFLALQARIVDAVVVSVSDSITFDGPWRDTMRRGFETYYGLLVAQPRLTTAIMLEIDTLSDEAFAARERAREKFAALLCSLVEQGREHHPDIPSRSLSPLMARSILGGVLELVTSRVIQGQVERLPELVDTSTDLLWSVVTNPR